MVVHGRHPSSPRVLPWLIAGVTIGGAGALLLGAGLSPRESLDALVKAATASSDGDMAVKIITQVRLPRILLAIVLGAGMGLAGTATQTLFRNPLASPYVLGISNGAALGAVLGLMLAGRVSCSALVPLLSVGGGLMVGLLVFSMARGSSHFGHTLLLSGVAISAFCAALTSAALYLAGERLHVLVFWLMGGLWQATWRDVVMLCAVNATAFVALAALAPAMNVALAGERSATDLGVNVRRLQMTLLIVIVAMTATAVAVSGVIGFVGLVVPHLMRLAAGADHRTLLPNAAAAGALLMLAADTAARAGVAGVEVPVGIITALIGAPVFLWILRRRAMPGGLQ